MEQFEEIMQGIRTATTFTPAIPEEEKKEFEEKKNARKWVEFPKTDCHRGWHSVIHRVDNWKDCGLLCHKTDRCNHWHFYEVNRACLMYENCEFKKGKGNVAGSVGIGKSCPGGDKNIIAG